MAQLSGAEPTPNPVPETTASEIGEYINFRSCARRFKIGLTRSDQRKRVPFVGRVFNALDPVLQKVGRAREEVWAESLRSNGLIQIPLVDTSDETETEPGDVNWPEFCHAVSQLLPGQRAFAKEVIIDGLWGAFRIKGRIDFVLVEWTAGRPYLKLVECKSSRRDKTYQRVQVAIYKRLVQMRLEDEGLLAGALAFRPDEIQGVVARIDESTNQNQEILLLPSLDLEMETADLDRLLSTTGILAKIDREPLERAAYQIDSKCDSCVHNVDCLPESGLHRRLQLIGIDSATVKVLGEHGVSTLDDLAVLELDSEPASEIRRSSEFSDNLSALVTNARVRRGTLPGGTITADDPVYQVEQLPNRWDSRLPLHEQSGQKLIRIFVGVDYDYTENRIGALSAHVTNSDGRITTEFKQDDSGRWKPDPEPVERVFEDPNDTRAFSIRPLIGRNIVQYVPQAWTGIYDVDSGTEQQLIQSFFREVVEAVNEMAEADHAPIHFYVWTRSEMSSLVEACSRVNTRLLGHLAQLLGCRESLEQMIFSTLGEEVDSRYALGWTGRGLSVVTSLRWFGERYHWTRKVGRNVIQLDTDFEQNVFDFKTTLHFEGTRWTQPNNVSSTSHLFEIRSRFHDTLPAPYWHAVWGTLPKPDRNMDVRMQRLIERFMRPDSPGVLKAYLTARVQGLRWIEERIRPKNDAIQKVPLDVRELQRFDLRIDTTADAALDFLRLEQHVRAANWLSGTMISPADRMPKGKTLPLSNVRTEGSKNIVLADINAAFVGLTLANLAERCSIAPGDFVRLSPCSDNPDRAQTFRQLTNGSRTCTVTSIDWQAGRVELSPLPFPRATRYVFSSVLVTDDDELLYEHATLDESPSDYVAPKVDARLSAGIGTHVFRWFDPMEPAIPAQSSLDQSEIDALRRLLASYTWGDGRTLQPDQLEAVMAGINTRIQLLQGPPGTGKTMSVAIAILTRILARRTVGDIILVAGNTHTAVNNLLERVDIVIDSFLLHCRAQGMLLPPLRLVKVHTSQVNEQSTGRIEDRRADNCTAYLKEHLKSSLIIIGGTTGALLKLAEKLGSSATFKGGFFVDTLIIDEASMMVFPHFLALSTIVDESGDIMLAGDGRQLEPILSHSWELEDRPPTVLYKPFVSAYLAVNEIALRQQADSLSCRRSGLSFTFRLPPIIRELLARFYKLDEIELDGLDRQREIREVPGQSAWERVWEGETGLYLVLHDEDESRRSNPLEAEIIGEMMAAGGELPEGSVAVITPYRNQRALLQRELQEYYGNAVDVIDTVERLQGDERPVVFVSGTASDRSSIASNAEFILSLNRAVVAFSRTQDRLIVVCSEALVESMPPDIETYGDALLWKSLRALCSVQVASAEVDGKRVRVFTPAIPQTGV